jgi:hypothetical protein
MCSGGFFERRPSLSTRNTYKTSHQPSLVQQRTPSFRPLTGQRAGGHLLRLAERGPSKPPEVGTLSSRSTLR